MFAEFVDSSPESRFSKKNEFETITPSATYIRNTVGLKTVRSTTIASALTMYDEWKRLGERTAFRYELLRRTLGHKRNGENLPEWPYLGSIDFAWFKGALASDRRPVRKLEHPPSIDSTYSDPIPWRWDLTMNENALKEDFMTMILEERKKHGLANNYTFYARVGKHLKLVSIDEEPVSQRKRRNPRRVKWKVIELLDREKEGSHEDLKNDQVRKARERIEPEYAAEFLAAAKNAEKETLLPGVVQAGPQDYNPIWPWLIENFPSPPS